MKKFINKHLWMFTGWLGILNFLVLQWFFIRLARVTYRYHGFSHFTITAFIVPVSGWWGDYLFIGDVKQFPFLFNRKPGGKRLEV